MKVQSYIICTLPRSGSTLLCDLLSETGAAGYPDSFFRIESRAWWADEFGVSLTNWKSEQDFDQAYLNAVRKHGLGGTPLFGMRLMWESVEGLIDRLRKFYPDANSDADCLNTAFGSTVFIHLMRRDKVAQAVSHLKAEQSGLWHAHLDGSERERLKPKAEVRYDAGELKAMIAEAESHEVAWHDWFRRNSIETTRVYYEDLAADPQGELGKILIALNIDSRLAQDVAPQTSVLADQHSLEWARRFKEERDTAEN
ncbi:MAG: Stf0 family sulfotransferase [Pseudomonadota bacterium]